MAKESCNVEASADGIDQCQQQKNLSLNLSQNQGKDGSDRAAIAVRRTDPGPVLPDQLFPFPSSKPGSLSVDSTDASEDKDSIDMDSSSANSHVERSKQGLVFLDCKEASKSKATIAIASYSPSSSFSSSANAAVERISVLSKKRSLPSDEPPSDSMCSGNAERSIVSTLSEKSFVLPGKGYEQCGMVCVLNSQDSSVVMDLAQVCFLRRSKGIVQPTLAEIAEVDEEKEEQTFPPSSSIETLSFHPRSDLTATDRAVFIASVRTSEGSNSSTKITSSRLISDVIGTDRSSMASVPASDDSTVVRLWRFDHQAIVKGSDQATVKGSDQTALKSSDQQSLKSLVQAPVKKCFTCKKRAGLLGFKCRCGDIFCALHRHSVKHNCPFDYKAAAKEAIAKANPLVRASKIQRI